MFCDGGEEGGCSDSVERTHTSMEVGRKGSKVKAGPENDEWKLNSLCI